ncbi:S9 family peptidase [Pimelobacter simplex]|uniref:S9 family peptidase n=1 Tax=Nocardioides simplex TaxID=2045 RepID=UPI00214F8648|nr:S9 family peptidase [Pimelobacter simplex]UUW91491.1 S9 family peptidase [Pimelobacter simplex]UUW95319.1 S9 family peptidase [Pimelobacter simplex]
MKAADLGLIQVLGSPTLSPDGHCAVVSVERADLATDRYLADLWRVPVDGAEPSRITSGELDREPRWSPDGRWLAFTRSVPGSGPQLHLLPHDGGTPRVLTSHPLGVSSPQWSPDSTAIAYVARVPEPGRYVAPIARTASSEPPRRITGLRYREDGIGYVLDRPKQVFTVAVADGAVTQHTTEAADHDGPAWSPDGTRLAFVAARHADRDTVPARDVFVRDLGERRTTVVTRTDLRASHPAFSADGDHVYFLGTETGGELNETYFNPTSLWVTALGGAEPAPATRLTDADTTDLVPQPLTVTGTGVLALVGRRGAVDLVQVAPDGAVADVVAGPTHVLGYDVRDGLVVAAVASDTEAGELHAVTPDGSRRLTSFGAPLVAAGPLARMHEVSGTAADGYPVHGWVLRPEGDGPFPVVLAVHGGPFRAFGWRLLDQAQACVDAGYVVVMGNPRGSSGYGAEHGRAVRHAFGDVDVQDLTALVDLAVEEFAGDPDRVGVIGASYGGFMAAWLAARSDRFASAIVDRATVEWNDADIDDDVDYTHLYIGTDPEVQRLKSPLTYAEDVAIPVLVVVAEQDLRCPPAQGRRFFSALHRAGKRTELLSFPGASHMFHDSGLPRHRQARLDAIIAWFDETLKPGGNGRSDAG